MVKEINKFCVTYLDILCVNFDFEFTENLEYKTNKIFMI
jgi:hypothetical protein